MKLLILRPEPGASATAARATAAGFEPVVLPFFEIQPRSWAAPDAADFDALLITSSNAIRHAGRESDGLKSLPVHTVGERSAAGARDQGFIIASTGQAGIEATLVSAAQMGHRRLLWLSGEDRREPSNTHGARLDIRTVYAAKPLPIPADAAEIINCADIIALHSPRAAILFGETADALGLNRARLALIAFSPAIAAAAGDGWGGVAISKMPEDSALLSAAADLGKQHATAHAGKAKP
jgi:uroporphyrinogen-III synthase